MEKTTSRKESAKKYFLDGYNCTQAVVLAFEDILTIEKNTLLALSSSFGGGMGRLREVCGTVSGMFIVVGLLYGYPTPETGNIKAEHYAKIQELAKRFEEKNGSIVCRELLGLSERHSSPVPSPRTEDFYNSRPCPELVASAAEILDDFIKENPVSSH